jgi:hypothetical protein
MGYAVGAISGRVRRLWGDGLRGYGDHWLHGYIAMAISYMTISYMAIVYGYWLVAIDYMDINYMGIGYGYMVMVIEYIHRVKFGLLRFGVRTSLIWV